MSVDRRIATVTAIHQPWQIDVEAPFRRFRRAGLTNARFGIDGREPFWGYHDPDHRWNGWATPGFIREVAGLIADWVNHGEPGTAWWDGDVLRVRGGDGEYVDAIEPDDLGLYRFDGWIWLEATDAS